MDFKTATDRIAGCVSHAEIAHACGASLQSVRQARMDPDSASYRRPPIQWMLAVARLARKRAAELVELAELLEGDDDPSS